MYYFWKFYFKIIGWKLREPFPGPLPRAILAVGPHTSWQDFIIGVATRSLMRIGPIYFLGKKNYLTVLLAGCSGRWMVSRWTGSAIKAW